MSEKVKLPKQVCDALDYAKANYHPFDILEISVRNKWTTDDLRVLTREESNTLMRALVLGYEPQLSAEEQIKNLYSNKYDDNMITATEANKFAIKDTLKILGIHYDWMDDAE